jgi:tRNA pseudouridine13 synthase
MFSFKPEEFVVEEITPDGTVLEVDKKIEMPSKPGKFTHFVLQKRLWNTTQALHELAKALRVSQRRFDFAGTKDRNSISTQLCSAFAIMPDKILAARVKDLQINGAWNASDKVRLGSLLGNRFTVTLTQENTGTEIDAEKIRERTESPHYSVANRFGSQRFGSLRRNTAQVGKLIVQGKFKEAIMNYLTFVDEGEDEESKKGRKKLAEKKDFSKALDWFPPHLKYERTMISHLNVYRNDWLGALRKLPRSLQLMFVHAYQSKLFNEILEAREKEGSLYAAEKGDLYCKANDYGFPNLSKVEEATSKKQAEKITKDIEKGRAFIVGNIIGSESKLTSEEKKLLKKEKIKQEAFKLPSLPELSSRGTIRPLFVPLKDFEVLSEEPVKIRFSLPSGAYATVALEQLLK